MNTEHLDREQRTIEQGSKGANLQYFLEMTSIQFQ